MKRSMLAAVAMSLLAVFESLAGVPTLVNYQGKLLTPEGNPISSNVTITVSLYATASGGSSLYTESIGTVAVQNGIYNFQFGSQSNAFQTAILGGDCWLELVINGGALSPRQRLTAVPYAVRSGDVDGSANWSAAFGWGNHATNGYLKSFTETDPKWTAASNGVQDEIDAKTPLATYQAGTGTLWTALAAEAVTRSGADAALESTKLASNTWAAADSTTNYVRRTGGVVSGPLVVNSYITNAAYFGNGAGLTNIPASAVAETDPRWAAVSNAIALQAANGQTAFGWGNHASAGYLTSVTETDPKWTVASNAVQGQIDAKTPLATYQAGTGTLWTALAAEAVTRSGADAALESTKLASNTWAAADSTTNYVRRTGGVVSGPLVVNSFITNAAYFGNGAGITNIPASAVAEADPRWAAVSNAITGQAGHGETAFGWGNHASAGYLTSFTEADPKWAAASNGVQSQIDAKTPLATYQAGTGTLWTALAAEGASRSGTDATLESTKLASNTWAAADSTTNYVRRTGGVVSGPLVVNSYITNALYFGDGAGITNIPASAVAEADPHWTAASNVITGQAGHGETAFGWGNHASAGYLTSFTESDPLWAAASNGVQGQIDAKTPLATYQAGTGTLWTAIGNEQTARESGDAALDVAKLASNAWAAADSTTNYVRRTGDSLSGPLVVNSYVTNAAYFGDGAGITNIPASAVAEADPNWTAVSNAITGQAGHGETAYGWGNHASAGYLTSFTELDPSWAAASNVVQGQLDAKTPLATYQAGTGTLWTAIGDEKAARETADAGLEASKLASNAWAAADSTTNYVRRTGDTVSGPLVLNSYITNAAYFGDGAGITNIPASAVAEADPSWAAVSNAITGQAANGQTAFGWGNHASAGYLTSFTELDPSWAAASNVVQSQIDDKTPLAAHHAATGNLWTAIGDETTARETADATLEASKLASNAWALADSTTNYVRRTGDSLGGPLVVNSYVTNAAYFGDGAGITNIPASAVAEADPSWAAVSNAITGQAEHGEMAYGWGSHADVGYLTSFTELDPSWAAASNGMQSQIDAKTPLDTYEAATGSLWTAIGDEATAREAADAALESSKLASNAWAAAESTTNYVPRNGGAMTGTLVLPAGGLAVGTTQLVVLANGNVGIGLSNPTNALAVNGMIKAKEIVVTSTNWPDYVFAPGYQPMPLVEVERFVRSRRHLPGVPSAADMNGNVAIGEMQRVLLEKIEELTLYVIELRKENAELGEKLRYLGGESAVGDVSNLPEKSAR